MIKRDYQLKYMSWPEIKNKIDNGCDTVIIVLASTEQHGPHMAECTDEVIGLGFACGLAEKLKNALVAPPIIPGLSEHHLALPGSLSLRKEIFRGIAKDYVDCYIRHGFKKFIFISSHGGNMEETKTIVEEMQASYPDKLFINTLSIEILLRIFTSFEKQYNMPVGSCGGHACAFETSVMLYLEPELVKMEKAKAGFVGIPDKKIVDKMFKYGVVGISEIGVLGDPTLATAELGEKFYNAVLDEMEKGLNVSQ